MRDCFRKYLLTAVASLAACLAVNAQDYRSGIGVKIGNNLGVDYKIFVTERQALDLGVGVLEPFDNRGPQFLLFSPQYLFHFNVFAEGVNVFVGPGFSAGAQFGYEMDDSYAGTVLGRNANFYLSVDAAVGIEYKVYGLPLALSFAWSPKLQFMGDNRLVSKDDDGRPLNPQDFYTENRLAPRMGDLTIGIRYTF